MAVQFILGRSGTGKTTYCVRAIVEALLEPSERPLIFLVPEQATYQAERAILSDERIAGYHRLHVLSFDRLQFLLLARNAARPRVSRIGRQMIIHKILRDVQDDLKAFGSSALLTGFARQMADMVTELHRYARTPEDVEDLVARLRADEADRPAQLKFADVALVFRKYSEFLQDKYVDPEARINDACKLVSQAGFITGARLWVDGFSSFTGGELALLMELLKGVERADIALCVDPARVDVSDSPPEPGGLFEPTERTYFDLLERAAQCKLRLLEPMALNDPARFSGCPPLAHLERNVFWPGAPQRGAGDHVRLVVAPNRRSEIQFVAREIVTLVRARAYRYRDIAVVASDLNQYEHYVRAYFEDYGIPFFVDQRAPLNQHPVVELICTALQVVTGGFGHADAFAYLKTDLVPIERSHIDLLENYCLAFGVDGRDWLNTEPWTFKAKDDEAFDEEAINAIRDQAVRPLLALREALCPDGDVRKTVTAGDLTRAVFGLLDRLRVRQTVSGWIEEAQQAGDRTAADEHQQFFDRLVDVFDELVDVFDRREITAQDYLAILHSAFSQMTLAFIPPSLDQVLVGSIERSRHPNLKAVFLPGATQKQFPVPIPSAGVLTDEDRDAAEAAEFHLALTATQSLVERQYLAYIAFTRPSELLCISYPSVGDKGSPVVRSHFVDEVQSVFDDLKEEFVEDGRSNVPEIRNESELTELLCRRLGRDRFSPGAAGDDRLAGLLDAMRSDHDYRAMAQAVTAALDYDNQASLEPAVVEALFGHDLRGSATRLATFAACPYKHFARYALELRPRREFKLEPLDLGRFYHDVLDALHKRLAVDGGDLAGIEDGRLVELLHEQIENVTGAGSFISTFKQHSDHHAFIIDNAGEILEECVLEIAEMVRAGSFRPTSSELGFGDAGDTDTGLGPFELILPNGRALALSGRIDRLDIAEVDGTNVALVLDYKRTQAATTFSWSEFFHGLDIQLPLYLLAISLAPRPNAACVAGAFCMPIERPPESVSLQERSRKTGRFRRKAKGFFNGRYSEHLDPEAGSRWSKFYNFAVTAKDAQYGYYAISGALRPDEFEKVLEFAGKKIVSVAERIVSGDTGVHPYRLGTRAACAYCDYRAVCRFDWQINDYNSLESKGKLDVVGASRKQ